MDEQDLDAVAASAEEEDAGAGFGHGFGVREFTAKDTKIHEAFGSVAFVGRYAIRRPCTANSAIFHALDELAVGLAAGARPCEETR